MKCQEFWNTMPELAPGADGPEHVRECPSCAALWQQQRALAEGLHAASHEWRRQEAPARLEARLTSAFRSHNGLTMRPPRFEWAPVLTWAVATAAIIVLAMFLIRGGRQQPQPAQHRTTNRIQLASADGSGSAAVLYADAGFLPLPNADEIDPNEAVNYVRVEVPRSSMIALGYAVSPERASELVQAEVLLGPDGLARAVRFLDE